MHLHFTIPSVRFNTRCANNDFICLEYFVISYAVHFNYTECVCVFMNCSREKCEMKNKKYTVAMCSFVRSVIFHSLVFSRANKVCVCLMHILLLPYSMRSVRKPSGTSNRYEPVYLLIKQARASDGIFPLFQFSFVSLVGCVPACLWFEMNSRWIKRTK